MHRFGVSRQEGMPFRKVLPVREQTVGAGRGQPLECLGRLCPELQAVGDDFRPICVIGAAASLGVEQPAGKVRVEDLARILVLDLVQAAQSAAVTERLPLAPVEFAQGFAFPEVFGHRPPIVAGKGVEGKYQTMKAVFLDFATMGPGLDLAPLEALFDDLRIREHSTERELPAAIGDAGFVFTNKMRLGRDLLTNLPQLRFIGLTATGTDNVDLDAAAERGIAVANIRAYCTQSVVEHVFGVLLLLTHRLAAYRASVAAGRWQTSDIPFLLDHPITELGGKALGIVGYGELGRGVARMGEAFGMQVLVAGRPGSTDVPPGRTPYDEVLARADVLSLHCPLNETTRNLVSAEAIARMKPSAILVNTARGGLVDSGALVRALESSAIAGAAIDVLPTEPPVDGDPLLDYTGENLIVTPHIAWASDQARQNAINELAANVQAFIAGKTRNRII